MNKGRGEICDIVWLMFGPCLQCSETMITWEMCSLKSLMILCNVIPDGLVNASFSSTFLYAMHLLQVLMKRALAVLPKSLRITHIAHGILLHFVGSCNATVDMFFFDTTPLIDVYWQNTTQAFDWRGLAPQDEQTEAQLQVRMN